MNYIERQRMANIELTKRIYKTSQVRIVDTAGTPEQNTFLRDLAPTTPDRVKRYVHER